MVARHLVHLIAQCYSLQEAAAGHDRAPEFCLSERDLGCFLSSPRTNQRIYANARTVRNISEALNLYINFL